jgi:hypothetical protein
MTVSVKLQSLGLHLLDVYLHLKGTCCPHMWDGRWRQQVLLKYLFAAVELHVITFHKIAIGIIFIWLKDTFYGNQNSLRS